MSVIEIGSSVRGTRRIKCGSGEPTLIIASVGTSDRSDSVDAEIDKALIAEAVGAGAVTDHSFYGDIPAYHRELVHRLTTVVSTVACYEFAARHLADHWHEAGPLDAIRTLEAQVARGIDMITVHASPRARQLVALGITNRLIPSTSKGGGIVANYMRTTGRENPYYEYYDDVLRLLRAGNVTLSLGNTFRAATVCDSWDALMANEFETMSELVDRALTAGVGVMVEGLGHSPIGSIPTYIRLAKSYCRDVPYRVLPMATDTALGFDHISGAIATAVAVSAGADAVTCMSRAEHIGLPTLDDLREAVIATRIAAHCGELVKLGDFSREAQISRTRWTQGCKGDWEAAVYPEGARLALQEHGRLDDQIIQCKMCGAYCGIAAGIASARAAAIQG